jgi:CheY-like chemotaxis protein
VAPHPVRILVVDDDGDLATMISRFLTNNGFTAFTATSVREGMEVLEREPINLLITDLMMPHLDGIQFSERVHRLPQYQDLPVILLTAYPSNQIFDQGMRRGIALTLAKPFDLSKLLDLVGFATH